MKRLKDQEHTVAKITIKQVRKVIKTELGHDFEHIAFDVDINRGGSHTMFRCSRACQMWARIMQETYALD